MCARPSCCDKRAHLLLISLVRPRQFFDLLASFVSPGNNRAKQVVSVPESHPHMGQPWRKTPVKKNAMPELKARWWISNAPEGLAKRKDLEKILVNFEIALAQLEKDGSTDGQEACWNILGQVEHEARQVQAEAEKLLKKPPQKGKFDAEDFSNTVDALKKYPAVVKTARRRTAELVRVEDEEPEPPDEGPLGDPKLYKAYLLKALPRLKTKTLNFAVGLGKKPDEHRFLFHSGQSGGALRTAVLKQPGLAAATWGEAWGHEEKPTTIVLALQGPLLAGLKSKAGQLLKALGPLPFTAVMLLLDGKEVEDLPEGEELKTEGVTPGEPTRPVARLRQEASAALAEARTTTEDVTFVRRLETARLKADLLSDEHGDKAGARDVIAEAWVLVKARRGRNGFNAAGYPELRKIVERAFKLGILEGGLKGGQGAEQLLDEARLLKQDNPEKAIDKACEGFQAALSAQDSVLIGTCRDALLREFFLPAAATKDKKLIDPCVQFLLSNVFKAAAVMNDNEAIAACALTLATLGQGADEGRLVLHAAVVLRNLHHPRAEEVIDLAAAVAQTTTNPSVLARAAENRVLLGFTDNKVGGWCIAAAKLAANQPVDEALPSLRSLVENWQAPRELLGPLAKGMAEKATVTNQPEIMLAVADLLLDLNLNNLLPQAADLLQVAVPLAGKMGQTQLMLNAAQVLSGTGATRSGRINAKAEAVKVAELAGNTALQWEELAFAGSQPHQQQEQMAAAIDAVSFLSGLNTTESNAAALNMVKNVGQRALARGGAEALLYVTSRALDILSPEAQVLAAQMAVEAGKAALVAKRPDQTATAAHLCLEGAQALVATKAPVVVQLAKQAVTLAEATAHLGKTPEHQSQVGGVLLEAAQVLAAAQQPEAIEMALKAAEFALGQKDSGEVLKAAQLLGKCGQNSKAAEVAAAVVPIEQELLEAAVREGDDEAKVEALEGVLQAAALIKGVGGDPTGLVGPFISFATNHLGVVLSSDPPDLDSATRLAAVLAKAGVTGAEQQIAKVALVQAQTAAKEGDYEDMVAQLRLVYQNDPTQAKVAADMIKEFCAAAVQKDSSDKADAILDGADLLLDISTDHKFKPLLDDAHDFVDMLLKTAHGRVAARAGELLTVIGEAGKFEPTTTPGRKEEKLIVTELTYRNITTMNYKCKGGPSTGAQRVAVDVFTEQVARASHSAYRDVIQGNFKDWDSDGGHLNQLLSYQQDWKKVGGSKELFYDLQKVRALQAGKALDKKIYTLKLVKDIQSANSSGKFDEDSYLETRRQAHLNDPKGGQYAQKKALKMLHAMAGYLIEERSYQVMPGQDEVPWSDQDTSVLGGGTRPDITLPIPEKPGTFALFDFTASNSQGHIFNKKPSWVGSQKVADAIEILYPSLDQGTLIEVLLNKQSFTQEEVQQRQASQQKQRQAQASEQNEVKEFIREAIRTNRVEDFKAMVGGDTHARHLLKYYGLGKTKGYNVTLKTAKPEVAAEALASLRKALGK